MNYDLEKRTLEFSKKALHLCRRTPHNVSNSRLTDQLIRSSTSVGANYREANETDTKKDFKNRIRIAKKEAKESIYWLQLIAETNENFASEINLLIEEASQLMKILAAIYNKIV